MSLLTNPFFSIGMGLLNRSGPSLTPVNPWMGINDGLMSVQRGRQLEQESRLQDMRMQQAESEMAQRERLNQWASSQSDPMAQMFPELYAKSQFERQMAAPAETAQMTTAGQLGLTGLPPDTPVEVKRDGAGNVIDYGVVSTPQAPSQPSAIQEYEYALGQGYQGTFADFKEEMRRAGAASVNVSLDKPMSPTEAQKLRMPDGSIPPPGMSLGEASAAGAVIAPPPLTEDQSKGTMFYNRAAEMDKFLRESEYDPTGIGAAFDRATEGSQLTGWAATGKGQEYVTQGKNFVAAILRKESGATITETEWQQGQDLYIPMPQDKPERIAAKARNREIAIQGLKVSAGEGVARLPSGQSVTPDFTPRQSGAVSWDDL